MSHVVHVLFALSHGLRAIAEHLTAPTPGHAPPVPPDLGARSFLPAPSAPLSASDAPTVLMMAPLGSEPPTVVTRRRCLEDAPTVLAEADDILSLLEGA